MTAALTALRLWAEVDASIDTAVMTESPEQAAPAAIGRECYTEITVRVFPPQRSWGGAP